jgi:fructose-bisphosphate aldolase, class II
VKRRAGKTDTEGYKFHKNPAHRYCQTENKGKEPKIPLLDMKTILEAASAGGYAVGAFNVVNLELLEAVIETAEAHRSPVIVSIGEPHFAYITLENVCLVIRDMAKRATVPVALYLDHGVTETGVLRSIQNGFTSVMFDGSQLSLQENIEQSRRIVEICHPVGVTVEAELGAVGGDETGQIISQADPNLFTDPDIAAQFVNETGIDALAVAIGNAHGKYKGEPKLDFDRLARIRDAVTVPLALHGGSGISEEDFRKAIHLGIAKINFYTGLSQAALVAASAFLQTELTGYHDYPQLMQNIKKAVASTVAEQMEIFGSKNKVA